MKPKYSLLDAFSEVFSLQPNSDYSRFVPKGGAAGMMRDQWQAIGQRLEQAAIKVGKNETHGAQKKAA